MPAGFPMEPSGTPAAFQCETTWSGSTGYAASETRKVRMRPAMIAGRMGFMPRGGFRGVMKMGEVSGPGFPGEGFGVGKFALDDGVVQVYYAGPGVAIFFQRMGRVSLREELSGRR